MGGFNRWSFKLGDRVFPFVRKMAKPIGGFWNVRHAQRRRRDKRVSEHYAQAHARETKQRALKTDY